MAVHTKGPPAAQGIVPMPERPDQWPLISQVAFMPWDLTTAVGDNLSVEPLQVMVVSREEWERLQQQLAAAGVTA